MKRQIWGEKLKTISDFNETLICWFVGFHPQDKDKYCDHNSWWPLDDHDESFCQKKPVYQMVREIFNHDTSIYILLDNPT